ncbi:hypothetical protein G5714_001574 [Onychostoma macrolepis]|uniref:Uncharacterized protein n=1 Tax=Onychostoma macrolepis TaxID=369639 RepID=A0A7J6DD10_9TELE|nr:hypothetical protein G5714_001574 [Onychostoma macrolepis]
MILLPLLTGSAPDWRSAGGRVTSSGRDALVLQAALSPSVLNPSQQGSPRTSPQLSLCPPYDDLFRVLEAGVKTFLVDIGDCPKQVLVDRLKPAHGDLDQPMVLVAAPRRGYPAFTRCRSHDPSVAAPASRLKIKKTDPSV